MIDEELIRLIVAQIEDTPQHWDQSDWVISSEVGSARRRVNPPCNTTFCFAGWVAFMTDMVDGWGRMTRKGHAWMESHRDYDSMFSFETYAMDRLGLDYEQADCLFSPVVARPYSADDHPDSQPPPDSLLLFKLAITEQTGIRF
jgi:hypothetical protein